MFVIVKFIYYVLYKYIKKLFDMSTIPNQNYIITTVEGGDKQEMEKTKLALLMVGIMLLTTFSAFTVNAAEYNVTEVKKGDDINPLDLLGIAGCVYNKNTGKPINEARVVTICITKLFNKIPMPRVWRGFTQSDGYFQDFLAPCGTNYRILVSNRGYFPTSESIFFPSTQMSIWVDLYIKSIWPK